MLHRNMMHHIGALVLHRNMMHHIGALLCCTAPSCTTLVLPHCEIASHNVKSKHAFQSGGVVKKRHTQKIDPHPEWLRLRPNSS